MKTAPRVAIVLALVASWDGPVAAIGPAPHLICVSNERSGDVTLIDGADHKVLAIIPVG